MSPLTVGVDCDRSWISAQARIPVRPSAQLHEPIRETISTYAVAHFLSRDFTGPTCEDEMISGFEASALSSLNRMGFNASFSSRRNLGESALLSNSLARALSRKSCRFSHLFIAVFAHCHRPHAAANYLAASTCCKDRAIVRGS